MATSSPQDGAKKKRKIQRPLIAPALPLNLKPRSTPASEPAAIPFSTVNLINGLEPSAVTEETKAVTLPAQALELAPYTSYGPEPSLNNENSNEPAVPEKEAQPERHPSSAAPELLILDTTPVHEDAGNASRSVTPKASSQAAPSSTQSPAPEPAQDNTHINGVASETLQVTSMSTVEATNVQPEFQAQAPAQFTQTARPNSTIMPRKYFSSEEPILDWADEMSEEMPPDTLHIPSVPHLPELSSDSNSAQDANLHDVAHAPAHPHKPVFGFTAVPELQSDGIAEDTPGRETQKITNGYSYSPDPKAEYPGMNLTPSKPDIHITPFMNGHAREGSQALIEQPLPDIFSHLNKLFETKEWADWTIQLVSINASYPPVAYHAHGVVISRSQILCSRMRNCLQTRTMTPVITLSPPRYVQPAAFEAALKYLYNKATLTPAECARYFPFDGTITDSTIKSYRLEFCFSYWLSGCLLGLSPIVEAGLELLYDSLDWDTAELLVKAALDMKNFPATQSLSMASNGATFTPSTPGATASPMSARTRDSGTEQMAVTQDIHSNQVIGVLTDALTNGRLHVDLQDFRLDTSPPQFLRSHPPDVQKHDKSHSALSSIMFGSLPTTSLSTSKAQSRSSQPVFSSSGPENSEHAFSAAEKALSAILLSVPFKELNELFKGFMRSFVLEDVLGLFDEVLLERASRRAQVGKSEWDQSEVSPKRRLPEVDLREELIRDGEQSHLISNSHLDAHLDDDGPH